MLLAKLPLTVLYLDGNMLQLHEFDELRFDVRAHDCSYFLRATSVHEKDQWVEAIEANKVSWKAAMLVSCDIMFL